MSIVTVSGVTVLNNPSMFRNPFQFEISYHSSYPLNHDLEWKVVYVGSADDERYDQLLETVLVGPVRHGAFRFLLQADPPEAEWIPEEDILGVSAIILTCTYRRQEFFRVGYYVINEYILPKDDSIAIHKVQRFILSSLPRITTVSISFLESSIINTKTLQYEDEDEDEDASGFEGPDVRDLY